MGRIIRRLEAMLYNRLPTFGCDNEQLRDTWVREQLLALPMGARILDAGAGEQPFRSSCAHLEYVSQDLGQYDGLGNRAGLQMGKWNREQTQIKCDIVNIPVPDESFDAVLCTEVLEHIADPEKAIAELSRILKIGGKLILTAPFSSMTHFAPYHYYTGFNEFFYQLIFPKYGLRLLQIRRSGSFFAVVAQELRRVLAISERYTQSKAGLFELFFVVNTLRFLERLSRREQNSSEVGCYGIFVVGEK